MCGDSDLRLIAYAYQFSLSRRTGHLATGNDVSSDSYISGFNQEKLDEGIIMCCPQKGTRSV